MPHFPGVVLCRWPEFIVGNRQTKLRDDELATAIRIPNDLSRAYSHFLKLGSRAYLVISITMVAVVVEAGEDGRVAAARVSVGACSAVACRLDELEAALIGVACEKIGAVPAARHLQSLAPISDVRAGAGYRMEASLEAVRRALTACGEQIDAS